MKEPRQCKSLAGIYKCRCQGVPKHTGVHWAYNEGGSLIQWVNKKEKDPHWKHIGLKLIPPGHKTWISPVKLYEYHYITIWAEEERERRREHRRNAKARKVGKR